MRFGTTFVCHITRTFRPRRIPIPNISKFLQLQRTQNTNPHKYHRSTANIMVETKELFNRLKRELDKRRKAPSPDINKDHRHSSAARKKKKKPRHGSLSLSLRTSRKIKGVNSSSSPLSLSLYSSMQLPTACLNEHDGCDEAELIARAKRCKEILKLSQEAKAKEAENARAKAAKNKSLI